MKKVALVKSRDTLLAPGAPLVKEGGRGLYIFWGLVWDHTSCHQLTLKNKN